MRTTRLIALIVLGSVLSTAIYCRRSASTPASPPSPIFPQLFPNSTGQNGYEDFVRAADLLAASPACQEYENVYEVPLGGPLDMERRVIADPIAQRVLATMRAGLRKRIHSPRDQPELSTLLPELPIFKSIGRLLCADMDVLFADGKSAKAIDCLNDGLNFERAVQVGDPGIGVVGLYVESILLRSFARHLNQLSTADCAKLVSIANKQLKRSDPQIILLTAERDMVLRSLRIYRANALVFLDKMDPGPNASVSDRDDYASVCRLVRENPDSGAAIFDRAAELVSEHFDQTLTEIKGPVWERKYPVPSERESPEAKLIYSFVAPSYSRMGNRFASGRAMLQMLAVHASIIAYSQQHGHFPASIEELKLGALAVDPFTGKALIYKRSNDQTYEISSAGAYDLGDAKHPPSGQRIAITFPYSPQNKP